MRHDDIIMHTAYVHKSCTESLRALVTHEGRPRPSGTQFRPEMYDCNLLLTPALGAGARPDGDVCGRMPL